jgi:hypothetical protein
MPPIDKLKGPVMGGLKAIFHPYQILLLIGGKKGQDIVTDAIRPGADSQTNNVFIEKGFLISLLENRNGRIRVGKGLEIGNKFPGPIPPAQKGFSLPDLLGNGHTLPESACPGAIGITVDTTPRRFRAVPVRTGKTGIYRYLLHPASIKAAQVMIKIIIKPVFSH